MVTGAQGRGRARDRAAPSKGGKRGDDAAGQRAVPLRADAAGRRRDGGGAGRGDDRAAARAAGRQRDRAAGQRPETIRKLLVEQVTGHGALARKRAAHEGAGRHEAGRDRRRQGAERAWCKRIDRS